jgi:hypothetical protein
MILNAHNSRVVRDLVGSHWIEDWNNVQISIYVDHNVKFGRDTVEGLRISPEAPHGRQEVTPENAKLWSGAVNAFKRDGNFDAVLQRADISEENQARIIREVS